MEFNQAVMILVVGIGERAMMSVAKSVRHELESIAPTMVFGTGALPNAWLELCRDIRSSHSSAAGESWRRELEFRQLLRIRLLHEDERQCATFAANQRSGNAFRDLIEPFRVDEKTLVRESLTVLVDMIS